MALAARLRAALRPAALHLAASAFVAAMVASLIFGVWYRYPYKELSGGRELFWLVVTVDIVCGPLLTLVLFSPAKRSAELARDLGLVVLVQIITLGYGLQTVWQSRPLFLVMNIDRFTVVSRTELAPKELDALDQKLSPSWMSGPALVATRAPRDDAERLAVLTESVQGGRDYAQRPDFYIAYDGDAALKSLGRSKSLALFLQRYPEQRPKAVEMAVSQKAVLDDWLYLPVVGRQDWVAILDKRGQIQGFLKGDGF